MLKVFILLIVLFVLLLLVLKRLTLFKFFNGFPVYFLGLLFLFLATFVLFSYRSLNDISSEGKYLPAEYDGNKLIPGKVEFEEK